MACVLQVTLASLSPSAASKKGGDDSSSDAEVEGPSQSELVNFTYVHLKLMINIARDGRLL